jgi:hypothetical protein
MENLRILASLLQIVKVKPAPAQGRFIFRASPAVSCASFRTEAKSIGSPAVGGKHMDSQRQHPSRHDLGVAWTGLEDHFPEPPGLDSVTALLGQHGEISQREGAVDALVTLQNWSGRFQVKIRRQQASASAGWPALRWRTALRKCSSAASGSIRSPSEHAFKAAARSPCIWWQRAIRRTACG